MALDLNPLNGELSKLFLVLFYEVSCLGYFVVMMRSQQKKLDLRPGKDALTVPKEIEIGLWEELGEMGC